MKTLIWALCPMIALIWGCQSPVQEAIHYFEMSADQVRIGDSKEKVLSILGPANNMLPASQRKRPDIYRKDGKLIEIYYFRSSIQNPQIRTDDEFTPYVFEDGQLVAIGWSYLGGPKTQARPTPETDVYLHGGWGWGWHYY
jgi:hypothetical protein